MTKHYRPPNVKGKKFNSKPARNSKKMGYDKDWNKYRFRFLHHNSYCYCCSNKATVVDHIRAHKGDTDLFENTSNHIPMCKGCHDYVTGKFDRYDEPKTEEKCKWLAETRKTLGITRPVKVLTEYRKEG